eukprot:1158795-Pelagomonas_calceolata.AAC.4
MSSEASQSNNCEQQNHPSTLDMTLVRRCPPCGKACSSAEYAIVGGGDYHDGDDGDSDDGALPDISPLVVRKGGGEKYAAVTACDKPVLRHAPVRQTSSISRPGAQPSSAASELRARTRHSICDLACAEQQVSNMSMHHSLSFRWAVLPLGPA